MFKSYSEIKKSRFEENDHLERCYTVAKDFLEKNNINCKYLHYRNSKYSLEEGKYISDLFCVETYCVKVVNYEIDEVYEYNVLHNDKRYYGSSVKKEDLDVIVDLYDHIHDSETGDLIGVQKLDGGNVPSNISYFGTFNKDDGLLPELIEYNIGYINRSTSFITKDDGHPLQVIELRRINVPPICDANLRRIEQETNNMESEYE
jgi:hypothetical protein